MSFFAGLFTCCGPEVQSGIDNNRQSSLPELLAPRLLRYMPELVLRPETLILQLWTAVISSMVKQRISKQEEAVILNQADPGLSKTKSCDWHLKYKDMLFSSTWYRASGNFSKRN